MLANSPHQSIAEACAAAQTWEDAVDNVVEYLITGGSCFSSGEVVSHIRTHRADLRFRHAWVGERLQNSFALAAFPSYDDFGRQNHPHQVTRQTSGLGRTPAGVSVFVYGPSAAEAQMHHFEVDVPQPGMSQDGTPAGVPQGLSAAAAAIMGGQPAQPAKVATAHGKTVPGDVVAKVHSDGRICIPKLAFESLASQTGRRVVGGEPLYATWNGMVVEINQTHGLSTIYPTTDQCRVHLTPPRALPVGNKYAVISGPVGISIDFDNPV